MNNRNEYLHMCLSAPTDYLAWKWMREGDVCQYCRKKVTKEDIQHQIGKRDIGDA